MRVARCFAWNSVRSVGEPHWPHATRSEHDHAQHQYPPPVGHCGHGHADRCHGRLLGHGAVHRLELRCSRVQPLRRRRLREPYLVVAPGDAPRAIARPATQFSPVAGHAPAAGFFVFAARLMLGDRRERHWRSAKRGHQCRRLARLRDLAMTVGSRAVLGCKGANAAAEHAHHSRPAVMRPMRPRLGAELPADVSHAPARCCCEPRWCRQCRQGWCAAGAQGNGVARYHGDGIGELRTCLRAPPVPATWPRMAMVTKRWPMSAT